MLLKVVYRQQTIIFEHDTRYVWDVPDKPSLRILRDIDLMNSEASM